MKEEIPARKKILAIEDDEALRQLLDHMLSKDYEMTSISDGTDAMRWLAAGNIPDLILADMHVPGLSGDEFLSHLKTSGFFRDIPLVILTGKVTEEAALKLLKRGAAAVLIKPFSRDELFELVNSNLP